MALLTTIMVHNLKSELELVQTLNLKTDEQIVYEMILNIEIGEYLLIEDGLNGLLGQMFEM